MRDFWCASTELYLSRIKGYYWIRSLLDDLLRPQLIPDGVYASTKKLNLGSSNRRLSTYVNVDALEERRPDIVCDVSRLGFAGDNEYDLVRASHVLEHFAFEQLSQVLAEWRRVLRVGGYLVLCVPNLRALAWRVILQPSGFNLDAETYRNGWIIGMFALDLPPGFRHKCVFHFASLRRMLNEAGFSGVRRFSYRKEHPYTLGITDDSCNAFSLNVIAIKQ